MITRIKRWMNTPSLLKDDLIGFRRCNVETDLPLLVIEDTKAYISKPKGTACRTVDFVMEDYEASSKKYTPTILTNGCSVVEVYLREPNRYDQMVDKVVVRGVMFPHTDGNQYIYWSWIHPDKKYKTFASKVFDSLARQGLDRRTVDNFRIDYRAGRIRQHHLNLK